MSDIKKELVGLQVLYIEWDAGLFERMRKKLSRHGANVLIETNLDEAKRKIKDNRPILNLVISNERIPPTFGDYFQITELLKEKRRQIGIMIREEKNGNHDSEEMQKARERNQILTIKQENFLKSWYKNGYELVKILAEGKPIPLLFFSSFGDMFEKKMPAHTKLLLMPANENELIDAIKEILP
jgi:hypothetical protein